MGDRLIFMFTVLLVSDVFTWSRCVQTVVDLTHDQGLSTLYWPGNVDFNLTILSREQKQYFWYESNWFGTAEHGGTHLDAPSHFSKNQWRVHQIPASRLIGPGIIINITSKVIVNPDYRLHISDLKSWEQTHGRIPNSAIVLMHSDWAVRYPNPASVFNTNEPNNPATFHFPGFHEQAITWLVVNRNISIVGVDTPSVDYGQSEQFKVHQVLGKNNIPGLENVASLRELPSKGFTVFVGVMKLVDGSGAPARIMALMDDSSVTNHGHHCSMPFLTSSVALLIFLSQHY